MFKLHWSSIVYGSIVLLSILIYAIVFYLYIPNAYSDTDERLKKEAYANAAFSIVIAIVGTTYAIARMNKV